MSKQRKGSKETKSGNVLYKELISEVEQRGTELNAYDQYNNRRRAIAISMVQKKLVMEQSEGKRFGYCTRCHMINTTLGKCSNGCDD